MLIFYTDDENPLTSNAPQTRIEHVLGKFVHHLKIVNTFFENNNWHFELPRSFVLILLKIRNFIFSCHFAETKKQKQKNKKTKTKQNKQTNKNKNKKIA